MSLVHACDVQPVARLHPEAVDSILAGYAFHPYRHWKGFGHGVPQQLLRWELFADASQVSSQCWLANDRHGPCGIAVVAPSAWESGQLGARIVNIRHLVAMGDTVQRQEIATALLEAVKQRIQPDGMTCLVHRLDSSDYPTMKALEAQGFHLVDTSISFIRGPEFRPFLRRTFRRAPAIRTYEEKDWPAVEAIARQSHFGGRFYHDPHFSTARVNALYQEWIRRCCQRIFADEVIVAERQRWIGGFLSYQFQQGMFEAVGIRLVGRGLLAVAPDCRGAAADLIRGASLMELRSDFLQCDIHLENLELLGLYGRTLRMAIAHVQHVFHGWIGSPNGESARWE